MTKIAFIGAGSTVFMKNLIGDDLQMPAPLDARIALMRTNVNVQELTVQALLTENREHICHAAYLYPLPAAELDLRQIRALEDERIAAHGDLMPGWITGRKAA